MAKGALGATFALAVVLGAPSAIMMAKSSETIMCALNPDGFTCGKLREQNYKPYSSSSAAWDWVSNDRTGAGALISAFYNKTLIEGDYGYDLVQNCSAQVEKDINSKPYSYTENARYTAQLQDTFFCVKAEIKNGTFQPKPL